MGPLFDGWSESFSQDIVMDIVSELDPQRLGELARIDGLLRSSRRGRRPDWTENSCDEAWILRDPPVGLCNPPHIPWLASHVFEGRQPDRNKRTGQSGGVTGLNRFTRTHSTRLAASQLRAIEGAR
jgi:hypothetical protein